MTLNMTRHSFLGIQYTAECANCHFEDENGKSMCVCFFNSHEKKEKQNKSLYIILYLFMSHTPDMRNLEFGLCLPAAQVEPMYGKRWCHINATEASIRSVHTDSDQLFCQHLGF